MEPPRKNGQAPLADHTTEGNWRRNPVAVVPRPVSEPPDLSSNQRPPPFYRSFLPVELFSRTPSLPVGSTAATGPENFVSATDPKGVKAPALGPSRDQSEGVTYGYDYPYLLPLEQGTKMLDEPFADFNTVTDALGHSAVFGDISRNEKLIQGDVGGASGPNADIPPSEVTAPVPQAPADPLERPNVRERPGSPNSALNTVPDDRQTEIQKGIEEGNVKSPLDGDVSDLITHVSERAICIDGRFGDIFTGIHKEKGKIALKRLRVGDTDEEKDVLRRFEREANTWRLLRHPYLLKFLGTYKLGDHICLVSPFIENGNVTNYIKQHPEVNRVRLLCEVSEAIDYLHGEQIVHGDIKGRNVLVSDDDHALLCDFGLTMLGNAVSSLHLKSDGGFRWQSPELWEGSSKTFASDVYAFSMTIVEVLTGSLPFAHLSLDVAVLKAVLIRNERPLQSPMEYNGVSYTRAWQVAVACWPQTPADRISMSEAVRLLREDPSLT